MGEPFKNFLNLESIGKVALDIQAVYEPFLVDGFLEATLDASWEGLELKDRIYRVAKTLGEFLPADYEAALGVIDKVVMNYGNWLQGLCCFFPVFVELYGQDEKDLDLSIAALARYTPYASSEFAIRPFILKHEDRMMAEMYAWAKHDDECVRRLASEGCRPQLPWGLSIPSLKKDPSPILPILEQLKTDPSLHVRKSVANNLNDISKTHPDLVMQIAKDWYGKHEHTDWIVKHACRTLLKKGNRDALALFGYDDVASVAVEGFALERAAISIGEDLVFSFTLISQEATKARLEYGIDYVKSSGKRSRKVFKVSEVALKENEKKVYTRRHSCADVSVRKHYPGIHSVALIVNGVERGTLDFELLSGQNGDG
ncbi:MAG: DNA alkylation repair protein [Coriobacteriia bacterium]|nr:DNA alkylation repair protein [Coriobacteriia bacterium]